MSVLRRNRLPIVIERLERALIAAHLANPANARRYALRMVLSDPQGFGVRNIEPLERAQLVVGEASLEYLLRKVA